MSEAHHTTAVHTVYEHTHTHTHKYVHTQNEAALSIEVLNFKAVLTSNTFFSRQKLPFDKYLNGGSLSVKSL